MPATLEEVLMRGKRGAPEGVWFETGREASTRQQRRSAAATLSITMSPDLLLDKRRAAA